MKLRIFIEPQQGATYAQQVRMAQTVESLGFDALFRSDHFLTMGGDGLPGPTDAWVTLAGLARETERIRLGTLVTSATFRLPGVLAVRVWKSPFMSFDSGTEGGMNAPPILGSPAAIETLADQMNYGALRSQQLGYGLTTLYALVAILAFLGWLRDRRTGVALWMAGFAAVQPLVQLLVFWYPSSIVMSGLGGIIYSLGDISLLFLLLWLLDLRSDRRIFRLTAIVAICNLALNVVDPLIALGILSANPRPWQTMDLVLMAPLDLVELLPFVLIGITR